MMRIQSDSVGVTEQTQEENWNQIGNSGEHGFINPESNSKLAQNKLFRITSTQKAEESESLSQKSGSPPLAPASHVRNSLRNLCEKELRVHDASSPENQQRVTFAIESVVDSLDITQPARRASPCYQVSDFYQPKLGSLYRSPNKTYKAETSVKSNQTSIIRMMPTTVTPQVPIEVPLKQTGRRDILNNMLTAWYWTGYYSGLEKRLAEGN